MKFKNSDRNIFGKKSECTFKHYRDIDVEEKEKIVCKKHGEPPIRQNLGPSGLNYLVWAFDVTLLNPSFMWDDYSILPKIETVYAFREDMNNDLVHKFNTQILPQVALF